MASEIWFALTVVLMVGLFAGCVATVVAGLRAVERVLARRRGKSAL